MHDWSAFVTTFHDKKDLSKISKEEHDFSA